MADKKESVQAFHDRRKQRLADRLKERIDTYKWRRVERMFARFDDDGDENNNNGGKGGHGNTRLPYGLCMRFGIAIEPGWTPKDCWEALAGKGITPDGAYSRLKRGEDPGTPDSGSEELLEGVYSGESEETLEEVPESPKEPKKTFMDGDHEITDLSCSMRSWDKDGPYSLRGKREDYHYPVYLGKFRTKEDMYLFLKEKGIEEFADPETGEIVNPAEMDIEEPLCKLYDGFHLKAIALGLQGGQYVLTGTDLAGKKKRIGAFYSYGQAKRELERLGVSTDKVKMSSSFRKREEERLSWTKSGKKEYIETDISARGGRLEGGETRRIGDLAVEHFESYRSQTWALTGADEEGNPFRKEFYTKAQAMEFLKGQGVENIKDKSTDSFVNPMEYEKPPIIGEVGGVEYTKAYMEYDRWGDLRLRGVDADGTTRTIESYVRMPASKDQFKEKFGFDYDQIEMDDKVKEKVDREIDEISRKEERRARFAKEAVSIGPYKKYLEPEIMEDPNHPGRFRLEGYDGYGSRDDITGYMSFGELMSYWERAKTGVDPSTLMKSDALKDEYAKYQERMRYFDEKAVEFEGIRYSDLAIKSTYDGFRLVGTTRDGREQTIDDWRSFEDVKKTVEKAGVEFDKIPMDDRAKERYEKQLKVKEALGTGKYFKFGKEDDAYTDVYIEKSRYSDAYSVHGKSISGEAATIRGGLDYESAIDIVESEGCADYKIVDPVSGKESAPPTDGMRHVMIRRVPEGGYKVFADTRSGKGREVFSSEDETACRQYLRDNNVDDSTVRTRGMNPNDTYKRTVVPKALENFDTYRMEKVEGTCIDDLTDAEKNLAADMLAEIYSKGKIRCARRVDNFGKIVETSYKSQIETGHGGYGAVKDVDLRKRVSDKMFGHRQGIQKKEYEKIGYIGLDSEDDEYADPYHPFYGGSEPMTLTFRKETMQDRVTYTYGDSLNERWSMSSAGYAGEHPTIEGLSCADDSSTIRRILSKYQEYKDGKRDFNSMFHAVRGWANNNYIEAQFHGQVTVKDIEAASWKNQSGIDRCFNNMDKTQRNNVIRLLRENGVKLYYPKDGKYVDAWPYVDEKWGNDVA